MSQQTRKAFTLVELLVVIGIIVILIEILLPAILYVRFLSQEVVCSSNVGQLAHAIDMYANSNNDYLPRAHSQMWPMGWTTTGYPGYNYTGQFPDPSFGAPGCPLARLWAENWTGLILPYVGQNARVWECPVRNFTSNVTGTFSCNGFSVTTRLSYMVNGCTVASGNPDLSMPFGPVFDVQRAGPWDWRDEGRTMKRSRVASDTIMIVDSLRGINGSEESVRLFDNSPSVSSYVDICNISTSSHRGKSATVAFFDHSVRTVRTEKLLNDPRFHIRSRATATDLSNASALSEKDLIIDNSVGQPRGYWTAAKND